MSIPATKATGWDRVPFLEVCDIQGGTQPPKDEWISEARDGYVRMLQIRDFTQPDRAKVEYVKDSSKLKKCEDEDILIGRYGASVGKILHGLSGAYNVAIAKCILNHQRIERGYLLSWLQSSHFQNAVENFGGRAAQAGFNKTDLGELQIPLPPLTEQKRIAGILDAADALRAKRRESLAQLDTLLQSTFLDMFGDCNRPPISIGEPTFGNSRGFVAVSDYARLATGHTPDRKVADYWSGDIPWISLTDIRDLDGTVATETIQSVTGKGIENSSSVRLPRGTVCFSRTASVGFVTVMGREMCTSQDFVNWVCSDRLDPIYLMWALRMSRPYLLSKSSGSTHKTIYYRHAEQFRVYYPPLDLQHRFAAIVESIEQQKASQRAHLDELDTLFASLQSRAFRGDL